MKRVVGRRYKLMDSGHPFFREGEVVTLYQNKHTSGFYTNARAESTIGFPILCIMDSRPMVEVIPKNVIGGEIL